MPFVIWLAAASPAVADECDAVAAGISAATFLHVRKRATWGPYVNFDVGRNDLLLACGSGLEFTFFGSADARFPPPEDLVLFSRAVAAMSPCSARLIYDLSVQCEQAALRDTREGPVGEKYGQAMVSVPRRGHLVCTDSRETHTFSINYRQSSSDR